MEFIQSRLVLWRLSLSSDDRIENLPHVYVSHIAVKLWHVAPVDAGNRFQSLLWSASDFEDRG